VAERYPHASDRRRVLVRLTPAGEAVAARSRAWLAASLASFPPDELEPLGGALRRIAEDLRAAAERARQES
jgi:DNA-binding MarR family transcriptional regulator